MQRPLLKVDWLSHQYWLEICSWHLSALQEIEKACLLDSCKNLILYEDIEHIILHCNGLTDVQRRLVHFTTKGLLH